MPAPKCLNSDSDTDRDGWGWENNRSCRVVVNNVQPGSDFDSAGLVDLNMAVSGQMNGIAVHYYQFSVDEKLAVDVELNDYFNAEFVVVDRDNRAFIGWYSSLDDTCLAPGQYYLILSNDFNDSTVDYTVNLRTTDTNCAAPLSEFEFSDSPSIFTTATGDVFVQNYNSKILSKVGPDGSVIWEAAVEMSFVSGVESLTDGSTIVFSDYGTLTRIDPLGQVMWSVSWNGNVYDSSIGNIAIVYWEYNSLYSIDLVDGSARWRFDTTNGDSVMGGRLQATQDGKVLAVVNTGKLLTFDQ